MCIELNELCLYVLLYVKCRSWPRWWFSNVQKVYGRVFSFKKNLRERLIYYREKEESTLFEVRMGFQKPVHLTSPLQESTGRWRNTVKTNWPRITVAHFPCSYKNVIL